jgi:hypothetical protein
MIGRTVILAVAVLAVTVVASAQDGFTAEPLRAGAPWFVAVEDRDPSEFCQVGFLDFDWSVGGWLLPPEEYANYCDPADCGGCSGWTPIGVSMMLHTNADNIPCEVSVRAGLREVDLSDPECPVPGDEICWSGSYLFPFAEEGVWEIYVPFSSVGETVDGPFFVTVRFEEHESALLPSLVAAGGAEPCVCYNDRGAGWEDLCVDADFPGPVTMFATLECLVPFAGAGLDIKPGSCPNPLNINSHGVLPAAILGRDDFDVTQIDASSVLLEGSVSPLRWGYEDVSTPVGDDAEPCECTTEGADGCLDMTLTFDTQEVVSAIMPVSDGDVVSIEVSGTLLDGTPFAFSDCVWIIDKSKPTPTTEILGPDTGDGASREGGRPTNWGAIKALFR